MILISIIMIPLISAGISLLFRNNRLGAGTTITGSIVVLWLSIKAAFILMSSLPHHIVAMPNWISLDALGALFLILIAFIYVVASIFSLGYMKSKEGKNYLYYMNYNLFVFSMLIIPLIQEITMVWVAVEFTTLFSVFLVSFEDTSHALEAAWKYVVLTIMGAAIALFGLFILYWAASKTGLKHYTWQELLTVAPCMSPVFVKSAFIFILIGFGTKVGLAPLHTWLPDAHSQAPTPICALLSGVETSIVFYVILRLLTVVSAVSPGYANVLMIVSGLFSVGTAAFLLVQVRDYKRLFAFSTVEHMGILSVAAGIGSSAHTALLLQIVSHAVTKSFCFFAAGVIFLLTGTRDIQSVRGLIKRFPIVAMAFMLGGLAIAGAPPFAVFLSEFSILKAGLAQGQYISMGFLVLFIAIAFFGILKHINNMVFGRQENNKPYASKFPLSCKIAMVIGVIPVILFGFYIPLSLNKLITLAASVLGGMP